MITHYRKIVTALLLALPAAACAGAYRQPEVALEGVRVGSVGLRGGTLYAQLIVRNPNRFDLETRSMTYDLEVAHPTRAGEWVSFAQGTFDERVRVDSRGSTMLEVPIQFRYDDMGGAFRSILDTGSFIYRVSGNVQLSEPIGRNFPYRKQGTVSLEGIRN
jgi:LEA14-like dessication related protein